MLFSYKGNLKLKYFSHLTEWRPVLQVEYMERGVSAFFKNIFENILGFHICSEIILTIRLIYDVTIISDINNYNIKNG
jgi:hypothetical protein